MIIYEVNLKVNLDIADEFFQWLLEHIQEMLQLEGFLSATIFELLDEDPVLKFWTIHYHVSDWESLNNYFQTWALEMQEAGIKRFPNKFIATRRVLKPVQKIEASHNKG